METLTKEERHELYKKALELFTLKDWRDGICVALYYARYCRASYSNAVLYDFMLMFPELLAKKPPVTPSKNYWFSFDNKDMAKRINILNQCVEETKP